ncbi:hypothetical protein CMV_014069 [Castanea mollissima]|uniref:Uncharacterized protein n=1 Tax=Castanea mollissima TaxID=60419 RepID=A0A8J4R6D4_9ROSI|nr:hypothetical protein CMV_014069 [Castanea mollissima]
MEQIMGAIQDVALAMREGNSALREGNLIFERSLARLPIHEQEVFYLLDEIGFDSILRTRVYLYLIKNPDMLRAFIGYPVEERKELLFTMMARLKELKSFNFKCYNPALPIKFNKKNQPVLNSFKASDTSKLFKASADF